MPEQEVVGIDGYPGGWVAAIAFADEPTTGVQWATAQVPAVGDLLPEGCVAAIDMPIGLLDQGLRPCDALARQRLPGASSRVFTTPPRPVLMLGLSSPNAAVQQLSRALTGQGVSRQALGLADRICALDDHLSSRTISTVVEAHPEVSFCTMTQGPPLASKKSAAGVGQRVAALRTWLPDVDVIVGGAPADVPIDDALDALACLWTAVRWRAGRAFTLPDGAAAPPFIAV